MHLQALIPDHPHLILEETFQRQLLDHHITKFHWRGDTKPTPVFVTFEDHPDDPLPNQDMQIRKMFPPSRATEDDKDTIQLIEAVYCPWVPGWDVVYKLSLKINEQLAVTDVRLLNVICFRHNKEDHTP